MSDVDVALEINAIFFSGVVLFMKECEIIVKYLNGEADMGQSLTQCLDLGVTLLSMTNVECHPVWFQGYMRVREVMGRKLRGLGVHVKNEEKGESSEGKAMSHIEFTNLPLFFFIYSSRVSLPRNDKA